LSVVGVQLREISNNPELIASTGVADGNTAPTQFAVKTYTENRLAAKVDAVVGSGAITASATSASDPAIKTVTVGITNATSSAAGAMSAADKALLDTNTADNVSGSLVRRNANGDFSASTITANLIGNASSANQALKWTTGRNISLTGDVTGVSQPFDGSVNLSFATTLSNTGITPGTYKSVDVDAKGRVIQGTNPTTLTGYGITDALSTSTTSNQIGYFQSVFLKDADQPSHYLQLQVNEDLTANRLLAFAVGNADRQMSLRGNVSFGGSFSTSTGYNLALTLTGDTNLTLPTNGTLAITNSPTFTGVPTAPTAATGTNTTQLATTAFVRTEVAALVETTSETLDALNALSNALGDDPNFATTIGNQIGALETAVQGLDGELDALADVVDLKAPLASPALTGVPTAPTAEPNANSTQIATTAFVKDQGYLKSGTAETLYAPLVSAALTGVPTAPTATTGTNTTQIATTAYVQNNLDQKAPLNSPTFTGVVTIAEGASIAGYLTTSVASSIYAALSATQSFTGAQRGAVAAKGAVTGTVTLSLNEANNFSLQLTGGTVTLGNPSNVTPGQSGSITITQEVGTPRVLLFGDQWKFEDGVPSISNVGGSISTLLYYVNSSDHITAKLITNPTGS